MQYASWVLSGAVAGWFTGKVMKRHGYGSLMDVMMGITGGALGGFMMSTIGVPGEVGIIPTTLVAAQGAVLLTVLMALASGKKRHAWASDAVPDWRHSRGKDEPALSQSRDTLE